MRNKKILITSMIIAFLILSPVLTSFGVSAPYWEGYPLRMDRGETKIVNLNLQNMVGDEDVSVKAELKQGIEIARLKEDIFNVKIGTSDTMAPLEIKIPRDAEAGETIRIVVEFKTITPSEGGMVTMGTGMTVSFDVIISEEIVKYSPLEAIKTNLLLILIIVGIILLIIIIIVIKRKKQKTLEDQQLTNFK